MFPTLLLPLLLAATAARYATAYPAPLLDDTLNSLEARQDSCLSWSQAPNSTVCCDHSTGQWRLTDIQRDTFSSSGPECPPQQVGTVEQDGSTSYSDAQEVPPAGSPAVVLPSVQTQQDYCNPSMQPPDNTLCCDTSNGRWKQTTGVIRDGVQTGSSACPALGGGTINAGKIKL